MRALLNGVNNCLLTIRIQIILKEDIMMVFDKVVEMLADYTDVDTENVTEESTFDDLGLDSLDTVELIMGIEDEFGVSIEMSSDFKTVGSVVKYIEDNME